MAGAGCVERLASTLLATSLLPSSSTPPTDESRLLEHVLPAILVVEARPRQGKSRLLDEVARCLRAAAPLVRVERGGSAVEHARDDVSWCPCVLHEQAAADAEKAITRNQALHYIHARVGISKAAVPPAPCVVLFDDLDLLDDFGDAEITGQASGATAVRGNLWPQAAFAAAAAMWLCPACYCTTTTAESCSLAEEARRATSDSGGGVSVLVTISSVSLLNSSRFRLPSAAISHKTEFLFSNSPSAYQEFARRVRLASHCTIYGLHTPAAESIYGEISLLACVKDAFTISSRPSRMLARDAASRLASNPALVKLECRLSPPRPCLMVDVLLRFEGTTGRIRTRPIAVSSNDSKWPLPNPGASAAAAAPMPPDGIRTTFLQSFSSAVFLGVNSSCTRGRCEDTAAVVPTERAEETVVAMTAAKMAGVPACCSPWTVTQQVAELGAPATSLYSAEGTATAAATDAEEVTFPAASWAELDAPPALKQHMHKSVVMPLLAFVGACRRRPTAQGDAAAAAAAAAVGVPPLLPLAGDTAYVASSNSSNISLQWLSDAMRALAVQPPRGLLLHGPPGGGKAGIARAVARAARMRLAVVECALVPSRYVGDSEAALRRLFAAARAASPCCLVLEDVHVVGGARGAGSASASSGVHDRLLATLLTELDGVGVRRAEARPSSRGSAVGGGPEVDAESAPLVLVIGITSDLADIDPALLRPGRLEQHVFVPSAPAAAARIAS